MATEPHIMKKIKQHSLIFISIALLSALLLSEMYYNSVAPAIDEYKYVLRDQHTIAELEGLTKKIESISEDVNTVLGKRNTVYVVLDPEECTDESLPKLASGWKYECISGNMPEKEGRFPLEKALGELQVNRKSVEDLSFFQVAVGSDGKSFSASSRIFSKKYSDVASDDGGAQPYAFETKDSSLWIGAQGLTIFFPFDSKEKVQNNKGTLGGFIYLNSVRHSTSCILKNCLILEKNSESSLRGTQIMSGVYENGISVLTWTSLEQDTKEPYEFIRLSPFILYTYVTGEKLGVLGSVSNNNKQYFSVSKSHASYNKWNQVGFIFGKQPPFDGLSVANIVNGEVLEPQTAFNEPFAFSTQTLHINEKSLFTGELGELRVYSRVLNENEVSALFSVYGK